ncbi:unnamed protein product, partial [marine sediment metagenome]
YPTLRARAKITSHSGITSSHHLWPLLNREILDVALLRLRFHSIVAAKSGANLRANSVNLFWRGPLVRVGIAMGEVVIADNTVTGEGVVLAQRVEQLAEPGGLCITGAINEALPTRMPFEQE